MKIQMTADLIVALKDGSLPVMHKAGEILSVYHRIGRRLLYARQAKWIEREEGDPDWTPIENFRVAAPSHDKMVRGSTNK